MVAPLPGKGRPAEVLVVGAVSWPSLTAALWVLERRVKGSVAVGGTVVTF